MVRLDVTAIHERAWSKSIGARASRRFQFIDMGHNAHVDLQPGSHRVVYMGHRTSSQLDRASARTHAACAMRAPLKRLLLFQEGYAHDV